MNKINVKLGWNKYKGDGKAWIAKIVNGKFEFLRYVRTENEDGTKNNIYEATRVYEISEDGQYVAHEYSSKSHSYRHEFEVKDGQVVSVKSRYKHEDTYLSEPKLIFQEVE